MESKNPMSQKRDMGQAHDQVDRKRTAGPSTSVGMTQLSLSTQAEPG